MELETSRLTLRPVHPDDLPHIYRGLSHPEVIPYYGVSFATLEETERVQMTWYASLREQQTGIWWVIFDRTTKEFMGAGGFNDWNHDHRKAEIGFWLLPEYWGQGIMTEAMQLLFRYGFDTMNLHRIEGYVESGNRKSRRAVEKTGFAHEGTMRECEWKEGRFISVEVYAFLSSDFDIG